MFLLSIITKINKSVPVIFASLFESRDQKPTGTYLADNCLKEQLCFVGTLKIPTEYETRPIVDETGEKNAR
jgi:hypothetical protein